MWMLIGIIAGGVTALIARPSNGIKAMLILAIPVVAWWLAYLGVVGPGADNTNFPQYMIAMLGLMLGITLPNLLGVNQWLRKRNSTTET